VVKVKKEVKEEEPKDAVYVDEETALRGNGAGEYAKFDAGKEWRVLDSDGYPKRSLRPGPRKTYFHHITGKSARERAYAELLANMVDHAIASGGNAVGADGVPDLCVERAFKKVSGGRWRGVNTWYIVSHTTKILYGAVEANSDVPLKGEALRPYEHKTNPNGTDGR
jgi:hypothetical protein